MRQTIYDYYHKEVTEIHPINDKVSRLITKDGQYALKQTESSKIEWVYHYIQSLHLSMFVPVLATINHHFYFSAGQSYYYLMPWLDFEGEMVEELKLRQYFKCIARLHNETFFVSKIQEGYFTRQIEQMRMQIQQHRAFYEDLMQIAEQAHYKAPWHWQMIQLYVKLNTCFSCCERLLVQYEACVSEKKTCRLCFTHNHFDLRHYCFSQHLLISLERCCFQRPTGDLYAVYDQLADHYLDFDNIESFYLSSFTLYDDEKLWLAVHLCLVPIFSKTTDLFFMSHALEQVDGYLEMADKIVKRLGFS